MNLPEEVQANAAKVSWYLEVSKLPDHFFQYPDYVQVTADNITDFEQLVKEPEKERVIIDKNDIEKFSVVTKFAGALPLGKLGHLRWAEISEPDQLEQSAGDTGVHSLTFFFPRLEEVRTILGWHGISYDFQGYEDHAEVVVPIRDTPDYFKLTSRSLEGQTADKIQRGAAEYIVPRAA